MKRAMHGSKCMAINFILPFLFMTTNINQLVVFHSYDEWRVESINKTFTGIVNTLWSIDFATSVSIFSTVHRYAVKKSEREIHFMSVIKRSSSCCIGQLTACWYTQTVNAKITRNRETSDSNYLFGWYFKRKTYLFIHCDCLVLSVCFNWWPQLYATKKPYFKQQFTKK